MIPKRDRQAVGQRLLAAFREAGAAEIAPDILLPAETLLDLYGEDIRARAYVTTDPIRGEMMLRPDFTVPVVQAHMENGAEPARYCYLGEVFRKQDMGELNSFLGTAPAFKGGKVVEGKPDATASKLTDEESAICSAMGWSEDEFLEQKKKEAA